MFIHFYNFINVGFILLYIYLFNYFITSRFYSNLPVPNCTFVYSYIYYLPI